jgi:hypothetical protein
MDVSSGLLLGQRLLHCGAQHDPWGLDRICGSRVTFWDLIL